MSSNQNDVVFFDENGLRTDQRKPDEIRPMKIKIGVLSRANGSCYLEWGANKVLAAVYGPREAHPRRMQLAGKAVIRYRYNMQSFSVEDRARPGPSRRSSEISKVSREAFEPVLFAADYPKAAIDIFVEVLQADAGTRTAAINAASLALVDAGIPMRGLVSACAAGKVDGKIVLDLNKPEDNFGEADLPIAMTEDGKITLIQMDGHLTPSEFEEALELVQKGCRQVLEIQKAALLEKFASVMEDEIEISEEDADEIDSDTEEEFDIDLDDEDLNGEDVDADDENPNGEDADDDDLDDEDADDDDLDDDDVVDEDLDDGDAVDEVCADEEDNDETEDVDAESECESDLTDEDIDAFVAQVSQRLAKDVSAVIRNYEESCQDFNDEFDEEDLDIIIIEDDEMLDEDDLNEIKRFASEADEDSDECETDVFTIDADDFDDDESEDFDASVDEDFDEDEEE